MRSNAPFVHGLYPNGPEATFDHEYYEGSHRELVLSRWGPMGLVGLEMDRGLAGADGAPAPYVACGYLHFESVEAFQAAMAAHGSEVLGDIPSFTNVQPVIQISEVALA